MAGDLTDVPGIRVGHWTDPVGATGCTVVLLPDEGAVASVDVRGAAPGTRETDVLHPDNQVQAAKGSLLSGGQDGKRKGWNSSNAKIWYAASCWKKKKKHK